MTSEADPRHDIMAQGFNADWWEPTGTTTNCDFVKIKMGLCWPDANVYITHLPPAGLKFSIPRYTVL